MTDEEVWQIEKLGPTPLMLGHNRRAAVVLAGSLRGAGRRGGPAASPLATGFRSSLALPSWSSLSP